MNAARNEDAPEPRPADGPVRPAPGEEPAFPDDRAGLEELAASYDVAVRPETSDEVLRRRIDTVREAIEAVPRHRLLSILDWAGMGYDPATHDKDRLARKILGAKFHDFTDLGLEDLRTLARLRQVPYTDDDDEKSLARKLDKRGLVSRMWGRVTGRLMGMVLDRIPDDEAAEEAAEGAAKGPGVKRHIRQKGLMEGVKTYVKSSVDAYVVEKMDEIEERVDRKLEEIERKMDRWREKEVRYRLRLIKITLLAAVIVAVLSLVYESVKGPFGEGLRHVAGYLKSLFAG